MDTTGAGDIFGGSALHRLLDFRVPPEELDRGGLEEIARFAVTAASLSTQHPGGIPSIPELAQVVARMGEPAPSPYESPLVPSPLPCYNQSFRLEGGGPLPVKEKRPAAQSSPMTP